MVRRGNPISVEVIERLPADQIEGNVKAQVEKLITDIRHVDHDQIGWLRKQADLVKLRLGNRKRRTIPWAGASNISIPLIDSVIRRWRPGIAALVLDADPIAFFHAQSADDFDPARAVEPFFTWLFRASMDTTLETVRLADLIAWRGHCYTRESWDYRTRNQARIISADHLFPEGIVTYLEQATQETQGQISPIELVAQKVSEEYDLDIEEPSEAPALLDASQKLLDGAEYVRITYRTIIHDRPGWKVIDPINVIAPQDDDPEHADFFCIIHDMSADQLRAMGIDGTLDQSRVDEALQHDPVVDNGVGSARDGHGMRQTIRDLSDRRAGLTQTRTGRRASGTHAVWEVYCNIDFEGTGERERAVLWYAPNGDIVLGLLDYPYPFEGWPITYFPFEGTKRPIDNRGLADMLRSYQKIVNAFHNARLDAAQIVLAPVLLRRQTAGNTNLSVKMRPGAVIPVQRENEITMLQKAPEGLSILQGLLQEEQVNQRLAEAYVGVFDSSLTNLQESRERRTAAEVNAIQNLSGNIFGLDAKIFSTSLSRSFTKIWQLYQDLGPEETFFRVTGEEIPRTARKREIAKNYDIRAAGTPANTNRAFQIQNLERVMQVVLQPLLLESGRIDFPKIFEQWLQLVDNNLAKQIIRPPEEAAAAQTIMQAAQDPETGQGPIV